MSQETPAVEASAEIVPTAPIVFAQAKKVVALPTAAEYIAAAIAGGDQWREMSEALRAAAPDVVTTDTPGLLPTPIVAPVYNNFIGRRPVVDAVGVRAMPGGGKVFIRPEVLDEVVHGVDAHETDHAGDFFHLGDGGALLLELVEAQGYRTKENRAMGGVMRHAQTKGIIEITDVFPLFANATTGTASTLFTGNASLLYKPSTGEFKARVPVASNGIVVNSQTVATSYTIAAGFSAMSAGPITLSGGAVVTLSSGSRWVVQ